MEARQAYANGLQQAAQAQVRAQEAQGPVIFVQGPVQNPIVPWREDMTLSQAIVDANYTAFMNPRVVRVVRGGQVAGELKGIDLLRHQDMDLQPGDTVIIIP
jgi:protein involved in polysaccharide export with SLBB domain